MDFPFHESYGLVDYFDDRKPAVFFGMYRYEDWAVIDHHEQYSRALKFWTGQDAINNIGIANFSDNVTAHVKIHQLIKTNDRECKLVKPAAFQNQRNPKVLGKKIYAYCPSSAPEYHGKEIIDELRRGGYEIVIGDGQFSRQQWKTGAADFHYDQCFIGLCLSEFAGGGESIIEMGLRGMRVVTNVFDLPNCDPWNSVHDVMMAIEDQTQYIGHTNEGLSQRVWSDLDHKHQWLNI
jgi:hypothetical protein